VEELGIEVGKVRKTERQEVGEDWKPIRTGSLKLQDSVLQKTAFLWMLFLSGKSLNQYL